LERSYARNTADEGLRLRLLAARARLGFPDVAELTTSMAALNETLRAARGTYAATASAAFRTFIAGAFLENPGLDLAIFEWDMATQTDREWVVRCRAVVEPEQLDLPGEERAQLNRIEWDARGR